MYNYKKGLFNIKKAIIILLSMLLLLVICIQCILSAQFGIGFNDIISLRFPASDRITVYYEDKFLISHKSYFEKQEKNQCGGFSVAYILRCLGEKTTGKEIYSQFKHTFKNGYVLPQSISITLSEFGYISKLYTGNLETLKTRLNSNTPIIVLIGNGVKWQHYVTVVGYDKDNIFLFDSNYGTDNAYGYNRVIKNKEFNQLWENGISFFEKTYFVVDRS